MVGVFGLPAELRCWWLQFGNLSINTDGRLWRRQAPPATTSQLVVPLNFAGHLGASRTVYRLLDRVYWPGLRQEVLLASCVVCLARKSPCPRRAPMGHVSVGHRWDRVAMGIPDMSVSTPKGNCHVLVIVNCFSRWTDACPLPNKTALAVTDAFFPIDCLSFWNAGRHPFRPGAGIRKQPDAGTVPFVCMYDLLPALMMAYHSSAHESTDFSHYRLMFGEECTLPMDVGLPQRDQDLPDPDQESVCLMGTGRFGGGLRSSSSAFWPGSSETGCTAFVCCGGLDFELLSAG